MPIAKLSRKWYETFGDDLTGELVDYLNAVEASYRSELRDLFEAHFGRFEEKLERRLAETEAKLRTEFRQEIGRLDIKIAEVRTALEQGLKEQTRWLFVAWASLLIPIIGLWMRG